MFLISQRLNTHLTPHDGRNRTADTVVYAKGIGEKTYYAVQAVPDTKAQTLYIVTAYIGENKTGAPQLTDAQCPNVYAQNGSAVTPTEKITQPEQNVNQKHSRELEAVEELKQQNELLKKQGNRRKAWRGRLEAADT